MGPDHLTKLKSVKLCQMQRDTTVTHGRSQLIQTQANPGSGR